ncbi:hypothetical protein [Streptomyces sioyaensis]|uniref:hypothetical protein n=1 Tax=Streptomyces sioyaensis TaxID=67364 RepID=UPI0037B000EC
MIVDITRGKNTQDLIRYVYGPGGANEHTQPRLVASWDRLPRPTPPAPKTFKAPGISSSQR